MTLERCIKKTVIKMRCEQTQTAKGKKFSVTSYNFPRIVESLSKPDIIKTHFDDSTQTRFAQFNFQVSREFFFLSVPLKSSEKNFMKTSQLIHQIKRFDDDLLMAVRSKVQFTVYRSETQRADFRFGDLFK
jgi:hypothetical protein